MRILAYRHVPFEGLGRIEPVLGAHGIDFDYVDLYRGGEDIPNPAAYDGLIFLGGPMSANDPLDWISTEIRVIEQAIERRQPVLGICLGSQLIAKALGSRVYRNREKEIGWFDLKLTEAARCDALFGGLTGPETVFHWHSDTFDLPERATLLAYSERCNHQAFRYDQKIYGLQFHLEVTPEMIADWIDQDGNCGDVRKLTSPPDPNQNYVRMNSLASTVFSQWAVLLGS